MVYFGIYVLMVNERGLVCCNKSILHMSEHIKRKEKIKYFLHSCMIALQKSHNIFKEKNKKLLAFLLFDYSGCPWNTSGDFLANGQPLWHLFTLLFNITYVTFIAVAASTGFGILYYEIFTIRVRHKIDATIFKTSSDVFIHD